LKTEFLILMPDDEAFCSNKKAFIDFLKVDSLISITGNKINYRKTPKGKDQVSAKFRVETDKVKSNNERYFLLVLECEQQSQIDEFSELSERIKSIVERISPGATAVNTLWDGVGRIYAEKAYPIINEVENLMRRLIAKFMLVTVGMNWSKDAINPELFKKIEKFEDEDPYINDLHKLDFIHLSQVLFEKKRDISLDELDRLLPKTKFNEEDKERILRYIPRSNWEKYFSSLVEEKDHSLEKKWELLYKLRNKVAHNRNVKKSEFDQIKGLASNIKDVIGKATAKLGEIDINEEDRELIIFSYRSESPSAIGYQTEMAVAEYYARNGYEVTPTSPTSQAFDFIALKEGKKIAVEVKTARRAGFYPMMRTLLKRTVERWLMDPEYENLSKIHLVCVLREDESDYPMDQIYFKIEKLMEAFGDKVEIHIGLLNEENAYTPFR
jgi:hypothetical protein